MPTKLPLVIAAVGGGVVLAALALAIDQSEVHKNPWTPPSTYWPIYELKIEPDPTSRGRWQVMVFARNSTLANDSLFPMRPQNLSPTATNFLVHEFTFVTHEEALAWAAGHAQFIARRQVRNPNSVRILDQRGVCIYAVKYAPMTVAPGILPGSGRVADWWVEVAC